MLGVCYSAFWFCRVACIMAKVMLDNITFRAFRFVLPFLCRRKYRPMTEKALREDRYAAEKEFCRKSVLLYYRMRALFTETVFWQDNAAFCESTDEFARVNLRAKIWMGFYGLAAER